MEILGAGVCAGDQSTSHVCVKFDLGGGEGKGAPAPTSGCSPKGYKYKYQPHRSTSSPPRFADLCRPGGSQLLDLFREASTLSSRAEPPRPRGPGAQGSAERPCSSGLGPRDTGTASVRARRGAALPDASALQEGHLPPTRGEQLVGFRVPAASPSAESAGRLPPTLPGSPRKTRYPIP